MDQHIDIEDAIMPLRTYAWAVTGSVSLADELLMECFGELARGDVATVPATSTEWFGFIDSAVVNWAACEQDSCFSEHQIAVRAIKNMTKTQPAILFRLLNR